MRRLLSDCSRRQRHTAALLSGVAVLAVSALARAEGELAFTLGPGWDSNARHTVGLSPVADGFLAATASARGRLRLGDAHQLAGRYDLGLRLFLSERGEDVAVQQADGSWGARLGPLTAGVEAAGKLRRSRSRARDYGDGSAHLFADWALTREVGLRLSAGARLFDYPPDPSYDSSGPQVAILGRYQAARRLALSAGLAGGWMRYAGRARGADGQSTGEQRADEHLVAHLAAGFRGPVALQAGYLFARGASNSFGESTRRHRFSGAATAMLPWGLFGMVQGVYQLVRYEDGIFLSKDLLLGDDESQSSLTVKLAYPLSESVDVEVRWAAFWIAVPDELAAGGGMLTYRRQVATAGIAARL